jgi:hypothetical protein
MVRQASVVACLKCRSGDGARRAQRCRSICHGPLHPAGGRGCSKAALSTIKYYDPSFDLQKVSEDVDLSGLVRHEDIVATAEVIKKFDFGTD